MFTLSTKLGTLEVKFLDHGYAHVHSDNLKINGVIYKISAYMQLHSNGEWHSYAEGKYEYEGRPYLTRMLDEHGNVDWNKEPTDAAYKTARELVETEFRNEVENWELERWKAEARSRKEQIERKDEEIEEKRKEIDELQGKRQNHETLYGIAVNKIIELEK